MARKTEPDALGVSRPDHNRAPTCLWGPPLPLPCPACFSTVLPASTAPAPLSRSTLPQQTMNLDGPCLCSPRSLCLHWAFITTWEIPLIPAPLKCHVLCQVTAGCPEVRQVGMNDSSGTYHTAHVSAVVTVSNCPLFPMTRPGLYADVVCKEDQRESREEGHCHPPA